MSRTRTVSESVTIDVSPLTAWQAVSDITQMGRWSPENTGGQTTGASAIEVGTSFVGQNRRGKGRWSTQCTVTAADPGERFAFRVHRIGATKPIIPARIATWEYRFEEAEGGTLVTETWTDDRRWPDAMVKVFDKAATGGRTFAEYQPKNIRRTLDRLKSELESDAGLA
ncbi:polyketide cyclase [Janibacter sp. Soil728]|uniref:SRPBCC family protein n=1 Tax=Janibacter sp. Soil728 TaxID=1736393 RepID=UPI0006F1FC49|nr:SRPBCC family protein [Janibacter sp. Soil728]KRE39302.1 polyketide cyclase [Janibacter sp. Soil728]